MKPGDYCVCKVDDSYFTEKVKKRNRYNEFVCDEIWYWDDEGFCYEKNYGNPIMVGNPKHYEIVYISKDSYEEILSLRRRFIRDAFRMLEVIKKEMQDKPFEGKQFIVESPLKSGHF